MKCVSVYSQVLCKEYVMWKKMYLLKNKKKEGRDKRTLPLVYGKQIMLVYPPRDEETLKYLRKKEKQLHDKERQLRDK